MDFNDDIVVARVASLVACRSARSTSFIPAILALVGLIAFGGFVRGKWY
jgi:hypothetical protein